MEQVPLFERLGGRDTIQAVVEKTVANHFANPVIKNRFEHAAMSREQMIAHAVEFFCTGLSGVPTYPGRPLVETHAGMNINDEEFCAVLDDILDALDSQGIRDPERAEVFAILYSMKPEVVGL